LFENITLDDKNADEGDIYGTANGIIDGITFRNLKMNGTFVTSLATANMDANSYAKNIVFELKPEIHVKVNNDDVYSSTGQFNFGLVDSAQTIIKTFTIENKGGEVLNLTANPRVQVSGNGYSLVSDAAASVAVGGSTTFQVSFNPNSAGTFTGGVSIANNDGDENPYTFTLTGKGKGSSLPNMVVNPEFTTNTLNWNLTFSNGGSATVSAVSKSGFTGNVAKIAITGAGTAEWHIQFYQNIAVKKCKTYTIRFKASADSTRVIDIAFQQNASPYTTYWNKTGIALTTTPTVYGPYTFNSTVNDAAALFKFMLGKSNKAVYIDDVEISETDYNSGIPDIDIKQGGSSLLTTTGEVNFGEQTYGLSTTLTFIIENKACGTLSLFGNPAIAITGDNFSVFENPFTSVYPLDSTQFKIKFTPSIAGLKTGSLSIANNDPDENPFTFTLKGTALKAEQTITFPAIPAKTISDGDFDLAAYSSSALPVTYTIADTNIAKITNGKIHLKTIGTTQVIVSQTGNGNYFAATEVIQTLVVTDNTVNIAKINKQNIKVYASGNSQLTIDAFANAKVDIYNVLGTKIFVTTVRSDKTVVDLNGFKGVCIVMVNNEIMQKVIVR
jgi:hypothetical protein